VDISDVLKCKNVRIIPRILKVDEHNFRLFCGSIYGCKFDICISGC
jgi:hypothetical protein